MKKRIAFLIITSIIFYSGTQAQILHQMDSLHDYCAVCHNHEHLIIKPPYTKKFRKELPFLLTSAFTLSAGFVTRAVDKTKPYTEEEILNNPPDPGTVNSFDRKATTYWSPSTANASDIVLVSVSILPALFLSEHHTGRDIQTLVVMYAEVFAFNYGVTEIVKTTVNRTRPYVYNSEAPIEKRTGKTSRESFFSGHTSQTAAASFYFTKVISDYHPSLNRNFKIGMWVFAATVPAVNGYLRVRAGMHFPTDVITGYVAGAATGFLIPELHRTKASKEGKLNIGILPSGDGMMMNIAYRF